MDRTEAAELADRLLAALEYLDDIGSKITPDQASASFDDASLQVFWRDWPRISGWAGALWRNLKHRSRNPVDGSPRCRPGRGRRRRRLI
jgi:hypothetical protein